ncbi:glycosyltransferase [Lapillicoccus sp.]|uniref:glycosyltransferase family 2 protein n=1 Tax=Lapillicoccus sp. TaxID=1909287 RepID=UPI0025E73E6F|nr:glycosyltransferase [Lapillicoccus sp.]
MTAGSTAPLFSIITPVYEPGLDVLSDTIASVRAQTFPDWEWILVDDCSPSPQVRETIRRAAAQDRRIRLVERETNGHIVAASNDALAVATGEFVVLLDHDDLLHEEALAKVAQMVLRTDDVDYLYTDEDKVDDEGTHYDEFFKPGWSPERLLGQMYTCHLSVVRRTLMVDLGGFRTGFDGSQDHDLVLRVTERARRIVHIPEILYHWRVVPGSTAGNAQAKPYAATAGMRAVQESLERRGIDGRARTSPLALGHYLVDRRLAPGTSVSIVIPTRGQDGIVWGERRTFVTETVRTALEHTSHADLEVVVVYDDPTPADVLDDLRRIAGSRLVLVPYHRAFNFSEKINVGVVHSRGSRVVLLNDDVHVISDGWLEQLVGPLDEPDVGMTGAKLYFGDGTIQHAGHRYTEGQFTHPYLGVPGTDPGRLGDLAISREVSGVTAACSALRRSVFDEIGGLSESLPVNFNDVDLSYKVRHAGLRIVWVAGCELYHFESRTRPRTIESWEHLDTMARWGRPGRDDYLPVL